MVPILQTQKLRLSEVKPLATCRAWKESQRSLPLWAPQTPWYKYRGSGRCFHPVGAKGGPLFLAPERPLKSPWEQENQ